MKPQKIGLSDTNDGGSILSSTRGNDKHKLVFRF